LTLIEKRIVDHPIGWLLTVFGQTSLFFYVAHILVYHHIVSRLGLDSCLPIGIIREYAVFALGVGIMVPLCAVYRVLRSRYSILAYL
ncbi:MAG: hypothetical protein K8J31_10870, partial [Anaerolineae bacterium]|nr:hypothetical protein [Anaerolineae bacterium]